MTSQDTYKIVLLALAADRDRANYNLSTATNQWLEDQLIGVRNGLTKAIETVTRLSEQADQ